MREYIAYIVDIEPSWGYQTNVAGLSKTPPSFTYPPPTTFLGALTEAIAKREGLGESSYIRLLNELIKNLVAIAVKPKNTYPLRTLDINRVIAVKEAAGKTYPDPENPGASFDAPARGKTIASPIGGPPTLTWVTVWAEEPDILEERDFWRIHRLGSKESVVSVASVRRVAAETVGENRRTTFSVPLAFVKVFRPIPGSEWVMEAYADPFKPFNGESPATRYLRGGTVLFALPLNKEREIPSRAVVSPNERGAAYLLGNDVVIGVRKA